MTNEEFLRGCGLIPEYGLRITREDGTVVDKWWDEESVKAFANSDYAQPIVRWVSDTFTVG